MSGLEEDISSCNQLQYVVWLKDMKKIHKYVVGNGRSILIVFTDNCGCFSLILNPNLASASYLKVEMWKLK